MCGGGGEGGGRVGGIGTHARLGMRVQGMVRTVQQRACTIPTFKSHASYHIPPRSTPLFFVPTSIPLSTSPPPHKRPLLLPHTLCPPVPLNISRSNPPPCPPVPLNTSRSHTPSPPPQTQAGATPPHTTPTSGPGLQCAAHLPLAPLPPPHTHTKAKATHHTTPHPQWPTPPPCTPTPPPKASRSHPPVVQGSSVPTPPPCPQDASPCTQHTSAHQREP